MDPRPLSQSAVGTRREQQGARRARGERGPYMHMYMHYIWLGDAGLQRRAAVNSGGRRPTRHSRTDAPPCCGAVNWPLVREKGWGWGTCEGRECQYVFALSPPHDAAPHLPCHCRCYYLFVLQISVPPPSPSLSPPHPHTPHPRSFPLLGVRSLVLPTG